MSKSLLLFISVLATSILICQAQDKRYNIKDALEKGFISVDISVEEKSPHYIQPLSITVLNNTNSSFELKIPNGQVFNSVDPGVQDIITVQEELITLKTAPISIPLYGMCIQQGNSAPSVADDYKIGGNASKLLLAMTKEIEAQQLFDYNGQMAVWAVTDGNPITAINGKNEENASYLRNFAADILKQSTEGKTPEQITTVTKKMGGTFKYKIAREKSISIAIFNDKNVVVKEFYNNPKQAAGEHQLDFEFEAGILTESIYHVKLIIDGRIAINRTLRRRT